MKRRLAVVVGFCLVAAGLGVSLRIWHSQAHRRSEQKRFERAELALSQDRPDEALRLLSARVAPPDETPQATVQWLSLELSALEKIEPPRLPRLLNIYERWPEAFSGHERAALLVSRALLEANDLDRFNQLRQSWNGSETLTNQWFWLDVDSSVMASHPERALRLLKQTRFAGAADAQRLARLSLMELQSNPAQARADLTRACELAPQDPNIRTLRARVLEGLGEAKAARLDRIAAVLAQPDNPFWRDQLGDFYVRYGRFDDALATYSGAARLPASAQSAWLKTYFWSRVLAPVDFNGKTNFPAQGDLLPLLKYCFQLKPSAFWEDASFETIPEARRFLVERQETYWLRLLQMLRTKDETNALRLVEYNRFRSQSWNPELESALARVLVFRATGELRYPLGIIFAQDPRPASQRHPFMVEIDEATKAFAEQGWIPENLASLLRGDEAFAALLVAVGWREAALTFNPVASWTGRSPDWLGHDLTEAIRQNRGNAAALAFLGDPGSSKKLLILRGELLLGNNQVGDGVALLEPIAKENSADGWRAAWFLALARIHEKQWAQARAVLNEHGQAANTPAGKTLLARIAFAEGNLAEAKNLYAAIEKDSPEAKAFLARQAFAEKDWTSAERLTEQLIQEEPLERQLYTTLAAIKKAEGK